MNKTARDEGSDAGSIIGQLGRGSRVAVIRLRSLGDSVLSTPAIALLKQARPDLEIAVVSEARFSAVWEGNPDIVAVLEPRLRALRAFRAELCLNLHGGPRSARLTLLSSARVRAAFAHFPYRRVYNVCIPTAQQVLGVDRRVHTAEHIASALFHLGVAQTTIPRAKLFCQNERLPIAFPGPYAVLHPIASAPAKTWPAAHFLSVAKHIKCNLGLEPVFLGGPGEDLSAFQMWPVLAGPSLGDAKALIRGSSLFVGNDSGPAHIAAAFNVSVIAIFGPSDPVVWAPWKTESRALVAQGPIATVTPSMVVQALDVLGVHA